MSFIVDHFAATPKHPHQSTLLHTNELLPELKDKVFQHQFQTAQSFPVLDSETFLLAEIVNTKHKATELMHAAHKIGLINAQTGRVDTTKVSRNLVNELPILNGISKQREFVMLLFFWEEEVKRWDGYVLQENAAQKGLKAEGVSASEKADLEEVLKFVQAEKRILPSQRDVQRNAIPNVDDHLPADKA